MNEQATCGAMAPTDSDAAGDTYVLQPRLLGLGEDRIIGGHFGPAFRKIDLSHLTHPVEIDWVSPDCGTITDGADSIVFQGIDEIILPSCMRAQAAVA